jgi:hypothetical protein
VDALILKIDIHLRRITNVLLLNANFIAPLPAVASLTGKEVASKDRIITRWTAEPYIYMQFKKSNGQIF